MYRLALDLKARRIVLIAGILLAASLLAMVLQRSASAQNGDIMYPENGDEAVATFTATDPEGEDITWSVSGTDESDFKIDDGVLTFAKSPNYEMPTDVVGTSPSTAVANDNTYEVSVVASAGDSNTPAVQMVSEEVIVNVTNVEEAGSIVLSTLQPQVEIPIDATLSDPDNPNLPATPLVGLTWEWLRGEDVIAGATGDTYTPMVSDVGSVLTARASYEDAEGKDKTAEIESAHAVRAKPATNTPPAFPDQDPNMAGNQQTRMVAENTPAGEDIGAPVEATDGGDVLTYSADNDADPATEFTTFDIDRATGQLKTKADLNTEAAPTQTVAVTATDPFGASATVTVTITVTNVDEAPSIASGATRDISSVEGTTAAPLTLTRALATYTATEPEAQAMSWSLSGDDAARFNIGNQTGATPGVLTFKAQPDFEDPADADQDNVYEVTVVVSDPAGNSDDVNVRVTVTNVAETGSITFSSLQPKTGVPLTATLTDPDGGITDLMWQWDNAGTDIEDATSASYTPVADDIGDTLTVTATYRDGSLAAGDADITLGQAHSATVVADTDNKAPRFPDLDTEMEGRQTDQERLVAENTASATAIGGAVVAEVDNTMTSDGTEVADVLTYTLGGTDAASFSIARDTGQLSTRADLDYETKQSYAVTVTATDPGNLSATVNVTIKVTGVNEDPELTVEVPAEYAENGTSSVTTFSASDPEGEDIIWTLTGTDMGDFTIVGGVLRFKSAPNYEMPTDVAGTSPSTAAADDNTYEFTVNASDGTNSATVNVTIGVTNVEEAGVVTLSTLQPQVGEELTAELDDPDAGGTTATPTWTWFRGGSVIVGATTAAYTPVVGDVGSVLTAKATYRDAEDANTDKTAQGSSSRSVRRAPSGGTSAPAFPDQNPSTLAVETAQTRMVAENTPSGRNIGAPVTASDPGDVLTYSLSGADAGQFDLDRATGQLRTKVVLNRETIGTPFTQAVTVTATDPGGLKDTSDVTITVTNVDEAPSIASGATRDISSVEGTTTAPLTLTTALATYTATEPEAQAMSWSLSGDDTARFNIGNQTGATPGVLTFKAQPDFEDPADADQDNVYEVTVVVSDPAGNSDDVNVRVTVTNVAETGSITFSSLQPKVGIALTATLDDSDGEISDLEWQWDNAGTDIEDATSASYTPVADDIGDTLTVTATYRDGSLAAGDADITLGQAHSATVVADTDNKAPRFPDLDTEMEGRQTDQERLVAENTASATAIGAAVTAEVDNTLAPDGTATADILTYSLGGADAASFDINRTDGQLKADAALDFEDKDTYMVTVTATDPGGLSATVNVTIKVSPEDEQPTIRLGGLTISGDRTVEVEEGNTAAGTYTAAGPDAASAVWTVSGDDAGAFSIAGGELTFVGPPDYENPTDTGMDNVYMVTVTATDSESASDSIDVTVTVADVEDEEPTTLLARYDTDSNGAIDKPEMIEAINDYLFGTGADAITKTDMIEVINLYLFG